MGEHTGSWKELGSFRASNVRGMQVFRPAEPETGGFYRYLRIDFLSHYGSEYYCPVSILKVYGLTQIDAFRRDQERDARLAEADDGAFFEELSQTEDVQSFEDIVLEPILVHVTKSMDNLQETDVQTLASHDMYS